MNSAVKIFDEVHFLIDEISEINNVKESIINIFDDEMVNLDNVAVEIHFLGGKKSTKSLLGFRNGKMKKQKNYGSY